MNRMPPRANFRLCSCRSNETSKRDGNGKCKVCGGSIRTKNKSKLKTKPK